MPRRACCAVLAISLSAIALGVAARVAEAHPLHTTLAQLTYDERSRALEGSIRVFASDFAAAVAKHENAATPSDDRVSDVEAMAYVSSTFRFTDAGGHPVALQWCGSRRAGDVLWLCVRLRDVASPNVLKLSDQMLCELFDDQVNIVQAVRGTDKHSVLFTHGDGLKKLW